MAKWRYNSTILDLSTRRSVASFTPQKLYPRGKSPRYPLARRLVGSQNQSGSYGVKKNLLSGIEIR
jgi:hypothetical protein